MPKLTGAESKILQYVAQNSLRLTAVQKKLIEYTQSVPMSTMLGCPNQLQFLGNLCRSINAKKTLDIGVYTGYSALSIAMVLPPGGKVVAMDLSEEYVRKDLWAEAGVADKIDLIIGDATQTLDTLLKNGEEGTYDFAFIDAHKPSYDDYYEKSLKLLRTGGIIAIDNSLWSGKVADETDTNESTVAIRALNKKIHQDERVDVSLLTLGDGTNLCFKR